MTTRTKKRVVWSISILIGAGLLLAVVGPLISFKRVDLWVCPISGSTKSQTSWFGKVAHEERTVSALEVWIRRSEPAFEPQWQHTSTMTYRFVGRGYACGRAPEIYQLRPVLEEVVGKLADERIASLVAVLRSGSRDEQREMIQSITDEVFDAK
jgi:hypothetical protein